MKYCTECGNRLEDNMLFCPRCGTKSEVTSKPPAQNEKPITPPNNTPPAGTPSQQSAAASAYIKSVHQAPPPIRTAMKIGMIICLAFAVLFTLTGVSVGNPFMIIGMAGFFGLLALMFLILGKSPKGNPYILGGSSGLKKPLFILICVIASFVLVGVAAGLDTPQAPQDKTYPDSIAETDTEETPSSEESNLILDVTQYADISGEELSALLGEPGEISDGTCIGDFEIPCVYYNYTDAPNLGAVTFELVNNRVTRFIAFHEYPFKDKDTILEQFGITKGESCAIANDTPGDLRYRCPSDKVDDFRINMIEEETFGYLAVTYDMSYYEEWYLPLSSTEEIKYKTDTQLGVQSILKSPKSAEFPWYDWQYGKNPFYIAVSSYVDAQNSFGAQMRSNFTFIYSTITEELVWAVFDDEVIVDNGYVPTADLIMQLVTGDTSGTADAAVTDTPAEQETPSKDSSISEEQAAPQEAPAPQPEPAPEPEPAPPAPPADESTGTDTYSDIPGAPYPEEIVYFNDISAP